LKNRVNDEPEKAIIKRKLRGNVRYHKNYNKLFENVKERKYHTNGLDILKPRSMVLCIAVFGEDKFLLL